MRLAECSAGLLLDAGKIYVEIERARLTKRLAGILEAEGKVEEAADTLQEVAVVRA
jgi:26S proteasome regulatory subunit N5